MIPYVESKDKVVEIDDRFKHLMALALNPKTNNKDGLIRCITSRVGEVYVSGWIDKSELHVVKMIDNYHYSISHKLKIFNEDEIIKSVTPIDYEFLGLEDPDIYMDENNSMLHVYLTIPFVSKIDSNLKIYLGHAEGMDLDSLIMTDLFIKDDNISAKEISLAPLNSQGLMHTLFESGDYINGEHYTTVNVVDMKSLGGEGDVGGIIIHPKRENIPWMAGHASPGPLLPKSFIDIGEGKVVGLLNGRSENLKVGGLKHYGMFAVGLFIYDYEIGKVDWISKTHFIKDSEAETITFASQFVETGEGEGIVYAHVDDSFVRAYSVKAKDILDFININ